MAKSLPNSTIMKETSRCFSRTVISVNQLSIYGALADLRKELNKKSSEDSAEDSCEDSESTGTLYAKEILKMRQFYREYIYIYIYKYKYIYIYIYILCLNARCSLGGNAAISETDTSRTSATSKTRSAIRSTRKLRLLCRSEKLDGGTTESHEETPQAWPPSQWQTSWSSWQPTSSEKWWWFWFPGKNSRKIDGVCRSPEESWKLSQHPAGANPRTSRSTDRQHVRTHTKCWRRSSKILTLTQQVANAQDAKIVSRHDPAVNWWTSCKQVVNKHVQQVVNSVEVKQSKIIKNTAQRKNPIIQQKINQVSKQGR